MLAHACDGGGLEFFPARLLAVLDGNGERDEVLVGFCLTLDREDSDEPALERIFARAMISQPCADNGCALAGIPTLSRDELRNDAGFELHSQAGRQICAPGSDALRKETVPTLHQDEHGQVFRRHPLVVPRRGLRFATEAKPIEAVSRESQKIRQLADRWKRRAAQELDRHGALVIREVDFDRLRRARQVHDAQDGVVAVLAQIHQYFAVARTDELQGAAAKGLRGLAHLEHALHPIQQRGAVALLCLDIDGLEAVDRVHDRREKQLLRVGAGEPRVAVEAPLHRGPHAVAVAQKEVVAHADLVAVVDDRRARHGEQQAVHEFDALAVVLEQRREPAADAEIEARARVGGVRLVHVVALTARDHLEGELVMVAQEDGPLAIVGNVGCLLHDLHDGMAIFLGDRHVHAWHQGKVIRHVAFVAVAEVVAHVLRPLVRFRQQHAIGVFLRDDLPDRFDDGVGFLEILVAGALALDEVGNGVEPEPVHAIGEPEFHDADDGAHHVRVVEVEIGLMTEEAMPVVGLGYRIPGPVG